MGKKYKKYKNFLEKFLDSNAGKRFFNIAYSVGAAIVIFGAMAKILHWRFGDAMLMIGMITEVFVFLISAFEKPVKDYKWEEVYPVLSENEDFIPRTERQVQQVQPIVQQGGSTGPAIQSTATPSTSANISSAPTGGSDNRTATTSSQQSVNTASSGNMAANVGGGGSGSGTVIIGGGGTGGGNSTGGTQTVPSGGGNTTGSGSLSGNITIVSGGGSGSTSGAPSGSTGTGSNIGGTVSGISDAGLGQVVEMTENMEKFAKVTESLSKISDALQIIVGNSDGIDKNTQGFVTQMESLNRNIAGLNTIYEVQLKGISGQISTIEHINAGLDRIKKLYDGSLADSSIFKNETEKMAQQLAELNRVYARLLQAMTTNMNMGGGFSPNLGNNPTSDQP